MARSPVIVATALALVCAQRANADPALLQPSASADRQPLVLRLFAGTPTKSAPPAAAADPISILPAKIGSDRDRQKTAPASVATVRVPMPRLRPAYRPLAGDAARGDQTEVDAGAAASAFSGVAYEVTGAIDDVPPTSGVTPAQEGSSARAPEPSTPPPEAMEPTAESDDLLGDPMEYFVAPSTGLEPAVPLPAAIEAPRPSEMQPVGGDNIAPPSPLLRSQPYELVRTLQSLQDQMAQGSVQALGAQQGLRAEIDAVFAAAGPGVWQDHRNAAAAVTYVLSGGSPQTLRELTELDPKPAIDERLLTGVLAYAEGRETDAAPLLANVDAADLPASMGAQVAIAQSALAVGTDPAEAMRLLAMARLLAPGTLAEEAAIRRQIFVADQLKDFAQVQSLARQYLDRFRHSVYAGNFRVRFAAALSHMDTIDREESFPELDDMLVQVEPDARCRLYLTVALASVIDSRTTAAKLAAERASRLALAGSAEEARARLYHAGALAAVPKLLETAVSDLAGVDRKLLSSSDQALYEVVEATIAGVRSGTDRAAIKVAAAEPLGEADLPAESAALQRARDALKAADAMLDGSTQ